MYRWIRPYPIERLDYMLADSAPVVALSAGAAREGVASGLRGSCRGGRRSWIWMPMWRRGRQSLTRTSIGRGLGLTSRHLAVRHLHLRFHRKTQRSHDRTSCSRESSLLDAGDAYALQPFDAVLQKTPLSFDVSVWEWLWPLITGARLVMARPEGHKEPKYLREIVRDERITTVHFVPSMLSLFLREAI